MSRILIVEDEESIAELEKDYLELSGFEVEIENNGETENQDRFRLYSQQHSNMQPVKIWENYLIWKRQDIFIPDCRIRLMIWLRQRLQRWKVERQRC